MLTNLRVANTITGGQAVMKSLPMEVRLIRGRLRATKQSDPQKNNCEIFEGMGGLISTPQFMAGFCKPINGEIV